MGDPWKLPAVVVEPLAGDSCVLVAGQARFFKADDVPAGFRPVGAEYAGVDPGDRADEAGLGPPFISSFEVSGAFKT